MAVALSDSIIEASSRPCNCYKIPSLTTSILEAKQTSNLKDQYVLGEQLGWGQFGVIRTCTDKSTGEALACKSIAKDRLVTSDDVRSIRLEIEIMNRLSGHPNVVDLKAVYEDEHYVHLVMELCAGGELFHKLEKIGRFVESDARVLFRQLLQVVLYCHENRVVHRDLKPENILLATKASSSPIKLADFGLATYIKPGQRLHGLVGSPFYIAPEVLAGGYSQAADVWSAGVILYILLSGMPPFWGKTKSRIFDAVRIADLRFPSNPWDRVSESAKDLIGKMLCTDPSQRLTAQQVLDHSWMTTNESYPEQQTRCAEETCEAWDEGGNPFSTGFMSRDRDISFRHGSPITCDTPSPSSACRSSFSSFLVEPSTPCVASGGFSFCSGGNSISIGDTEISAPVPSLPSFAFFSPGSVVDYASCKAEISADESIHEEASLDKLLLLPDSSVCFTHLASRQMENKPTEFKRAGETSWSRISGIHSKRNRTIGLGEHEQIDFVVSESVIRWSSCTHFPTSLRASLVC